MRKAILSVSMIFLVSAILLFSAFHVQPARAETPAPGVQWERTYGGTGDDQALDLVQTLDGGYALAGFSFSYLVKTDGTGAQEWAHSYSINPVRSLIQTNDGGFALAGLAGGLVKTDSAGNMQWTQNYPDINYYAWVSVVQTKDGGYAYAGQTGSFGINTDFRLIKTDSNGVVQWTRDYDKTIDDWVNSVIQTSDGGYLMVGVTAYPPNYYRTAWLVKTDQNGNLQWEYTYGGESAASSAVEADDRGFVIVGTTLSPNWDLWVFKISSYGTTLWSKAFGGAADDEGYSISRTVDGGYAVAGVTRSIGAGNGDFWVIKLDGNGEEIWDLTVGGSEIDVAWSIIQTSDFGYAIAGYTKSYGPGLEDFWLVKLAPMSAHAIYIRADGSIDPLTAPISTVDNTTYTLTGNIVLDAFVDGIVVERSNIVVDGAGYTLQGLQQYGTFLSGFNLANVHNVTIKNSNVESFDYGIKLTRGFGNTVSGNDLANNKWDGVYLDDSDNNSVDNNHVRNGENCGISLGVTSCGNSFFGNNIADNGYAFALGQSSGNTFVGNNITDNGEGIRLDDLSVNNSIYHNTFINNTMQVRILLGNPINSWDNGYPSGGNYWSDYTGQDSFRGPYQNILGSDGIGDTPYVINTNNQDRYPFTNPQMITWEYVFKDRIQGTTLKISTDDKYFQFTGPSKDFGIKQDPTMKVTCNGILICYSDRDMSLVAIAGTGRFKFCTAIAYDKPAHKTYWLMWTSFLQGRTFD